jgi:uridine kinase
VDNGTRDELLRRLAEAVGSVTIAHPTRVAIDGPPAAGKTTLADELAVVLRAQGREVIRASIESFLLSRSRRYRRGEYSAEGCYLDSFDYDALCRVLLDPLGPGGDRMIQRAVYDKPTDAALSQPVTTVPADAVLLFDGVFLLRPELIDRWDLRIFVSAAFEETLVRARTRDRVLYGSVTEVERRFHERYRPSQELYFDTARPADHADIVVHNDEPDQPTWEQRSEAVASNQGGESGALASATAFLVANVGPDVTKVRALGAGEWSRAYAFELLGGCYVVRFSRYLDDFEKDRRAAAYSGPDLPIPAIVDVGTTENGYFAISDHKAGVGLDTLDEHEMLALLPRLLRTLDAIAGVDVTDTRGLGYWTADGAGTSTSWRSSLLVVGADRSGSRIHGWRARLANSNAGTEVFDHGYRRLTELVERCPDERRLVHSDLLNNNVLVDDGQISAVLDWGSSKYGDPLYDAAWLSFWWPWYEPWQTIDIDAALLNHLGAQLEVNVRLQCYRLHIGLEGMAYEAFAGHWIELAWTAQRTRTLLEAVA